MQISKRCPRSTIFVLAIFVLYVIITMSTLGEKRDSKIQIQPPYLEDMSAKWKQKDTGADSYLCRAIHNSKLRNTMFKKDPANAHFRKFYPVVARAKGIGPTSKPGIFKLWIDKSAPYLGLHWDGKEVQQSCGFYRVNLPVVPRSGSTWFRQIWEEVTGLTSGNMWFEQSNFDPHYQAYINKSRCGTYFKEAGGVKIPPDCSKLYVRPPEINEAFLFRSHIPFYPTFPSDLGANCIDFNILMLRNPFDVFHSLVRCPTGVCYSAMEFLGKWVAHYDFWMSQAQPLYVFRYEDMRLNLNETLSGLFNALPKVLTKGVTPTKLKKVVETQATNVTTFGQKCGGNMRYNWNRGEMFQVMAYYASHMIKYGYRLEFEPDEKTI